MIRTTRGFNVTVAASGMTVAVTLMARVGLSQTEHRFVTAGDVEAGNSLTPLRQRKYGSTGARSRGHSA